MRKMVLGAIGDVLFFPQGRLEQAAALIATNEDSSITKGIDILRALSTSDWHGEHLRMATAAILQPFCELRIKEIRTLLKTDEATALSKAQAFLRLMPENQEVQGMVAAYGKGKEAAMLG